MRPAFILAIVVLVVTGPLGSVESAAPGHHGRPETPGTPAAPATPATLSSRPLIPGSGSGHGGHTAGRRHPASFVGDRRELTRTTPSGGALSLDRGAIGGLHARGSAISMGADARPIQIGSGDFPHQIASLRRV